MYAEAPWEQGIAREWRMRGYSCSYRAGRSRSSQPRAIHDRDTVIIPLEGSLRIEIRDQELNAFPGQQVVIPAHARHSIRVPGPNSSIWLQALEQDVAHTD